MATEPPASRRSVLADLQARRAVVLHHVEIHRAGELVADADVAEVPETAMAAALHVASLCSPREVERALVDEVDAVSDARPGSSARLELPGQASEMLGRVVEVYDDVHVHRTGDVVIASATVADHQH